MASRTEILGWKENFDAASVDYPKSKSLAHVSRSLAHASRSLANASKTLVRCKFA